MLKADVYHPETDAQLFPEPWSLLSPVIPPSYTLSMMSYGIKQSHG